MSNLYIKRTLNAPQQDLEAAAHRAIAKLEDRYGAVVEWQGNKANISGGGVKGEMVLAEGTVEVRLKLGLLASAFKGRIEQELNEYLDRFEG